MDRDALLWDLPLAGVEVVDGAVVVVYALDSIRAVLCARVIRTVARISGGSEAQAPKGGADHARDPRGFGMRRRPAPFFFSSAGSPLISTPRFTSCASTDLKALL